MSCLDIHLGDVGTQFNITIVDEDSVVVNISTATQLKIIFKKPDGSEVIKDGTLTTDGADGKLHYVSEINFLDYVGLWQLQAHIIYSASQWYSSVDKFIVKPNL